MKIPELFKNKRIAPIERIKAEEILKIEGKPYGYTDIINLLFSRAFIDVYITVT